MKTVIITINSPREASELCNIINRFDGSYDLRCGHRDVDAKSILGIMSLQIPGSMELSGDLPDELINAIERFRGGIKK